MCVVNVIPFMSVAKADSVSLSLSEAMPSDWLNMSFTIAIASLVLTVGEGAQIPCKQCTVVDYPHH